MAESCKGAEISETQKKTMTSANNGSQRCWYWNDSWTVSLFFLIWCFCWDQRVGTFGTSSLNLEHINSVSPTGSVVSSVLVCNDPIVGERVGRSLPWSQLCTTLSDTCEVQTAKREPGGKIWWTEDMTGCNNFAEFFRVDDMMMFLLRA